MRENAVDGNGVTYLVLDKISESDTKLVAYYTLSVNAIPYIDRWKKDESDIKDGIKYDELLCGVPVIEIKMFAVSKDYQDIFYEFDGEEKPISAWILDSIIGYIYELSQNIVSAKAVFLRSVKNAEKFYLENGFQYVLHNMEPFYPIDHDLEPMFLPFVDLKIHYDE